MHSLSYCKSLLYKAFAFYCFFLSIFWLSDKFIRNIKILNLLKKTKTFMMNYIITEIQGCKNKKSRVNKGALKNERLLR